MLLARCWIQLLPAANGKAAAAASVTQKRQELELAVSTSFRSNWTAGNREKLFRRLNRVSDIYYI